MVLCWITMNFSWHTGITNIWSERKGEQQQGHRLELLHAIGQNNLVACEIPLIMLNIYLSVTLR